MSATPTRSPDIVIVESGMGTTRVKDGDRVRVDGTTGVVEILERASGPAGAI